MPTNNIRPGISRSASVIPASSAPTTLARHHTIVGPRRPSMPPLPPSAVGTATTSIENAHHNYRSQEGPSQKPLGSRFPPSSSSELSLATLSSSDPAAPISGLDTSSRLWSALPEMPSNQFPMAQSKDHGGWSSLPPSQPAPSASTLAPTPPSSLSQGRAPEAVLGYLREASELHSLTLPELENLVSVFVHEPGFPKLVRSPFRSFLRFYTGLLGLRSELNGCCSVSSKSWTRCGSPKDFQGGEREKRGGHVVMFTH
jgi:hypothetical protein